MSKNDVIETIRIFSKQYPSVIYLNERPLVSVDFLKSEFASNIDLRWLEKKLNEADFKTLELELYKSFEYELKKELKEPNSYFR